jgi:hypothetical protein
MYFPTYSNSFTLNNPVGNCTKDQILDEGGAKADQSRFSYCVCCDYYYPQAELGCPSNPWGKLGYYTESFNI